MRNHGIKSLDQIIGSNHWIKSLDQITGSNHWIESLDRIAGIKSLESNHWNQIARIKSLDQITKSNHWIKSLESNHWIKSLESNHWIKSLDQITGSNTGSNISSLVPPRTRYQAVVIRTTSYADQKVLVCCVCLMPEGLRWINADL